MPAIYISHVIEKGDDLETIGKKLYLGVISAGEQSYTLGAAIAECRKQLDALDKLVTALRADLNTYTIEWRKELGSKLKPEVSERGGE